MNRRRYAVPAGEEPNRHARLFRQQTIEFRYDEHGLRESAERLDRGEFILLNQERELGFPVPWNPHGTTRLWRYNLHYFDYVLDLGVLAKWRNDEQAGKTLRKLIGDWIESNPVGAGVGWHSYPVSRRIVNWLQSASLASDAIDWDGSGFRKTWTQSLFQQAHYLEDHLEVDLSGNHLLANAKALFFAGVFWGNEIGARWREKGLGLLWDGLKEQILEDGGQYERSPMYQAIVLQDYLQVIHLLHVEGRQTPSWVQGRLILMADFLFSMLHPDGEISLFADAAFGIAYEPFDVLAAAEHLLDVSGRWAGAVPGPFSSLVQVPCGKVASVSNSHVGQSSLPATGYFSLLNGEEGDKFIIDGKPMGPDHLPAHGHCSLFSYELSIAGERFIVDSGVEEYEAGPWRDFWRSTRAHNTVSVDGAEQSEIWASFRVGQRTRLLGYTCLQQDSSAIFVGLHSGFAGQKQPTPHRRFIAALPKRRWIVMDEVFGAGNHTIQSFIHFAPGTECQMEDQVVTLRSASREMRLLPLIEGSGAKVTCVQGQKAPVQGWYAPEFGKALCNSVVELELPSALPARFGYLLAPSEQRCKSWSFQTAERPGFARIEITIQSPAATEVEHFNLSALPSSPMMRSNPNLEQRW
ncbi:MAG: heparinase II/III family protein [Terracidiphilus sp.]